MWRRKAAYTRPRLRTCEKIKTAHAKSLRRKEAQSRSHLFPLRAWRTWRLCVKPFVCPRDFFTRSEALLEVVRFPFALLLRWAYHCFDAATSSRELGLVNRQTESVVSRGLAPWDDEVYPQWSGKVRCPIVQTKRGDSSSPRNSARRTAGRPYFCCC